MKIFVTVQFSLRMELDASHVLKIDENEFRHQVILITIFLLNELLLRQFGLLIWMRFTFAAYLVLSQFFRRQYSIVVTGHINQQ